jgi:hypothetical protein
MKVALLGTAPSSRMLAPFSNDEWEIWACSPDNAHGRLPRVTRWFEIHGDLGWPESAGWGAPAYIEWLNMQEFPIYAQDQSYILDAITFPKDDLVRKFTPYFFTSTFAWMMAFAIDSKVKEILLYGIDMMLEDEYAEQRPAMHHFIALAAANGIKVGAPDESPILAAPPLYGYRDSTPMGRAQAVHIAELEARIREMKKLVKENEHNITYLEGARDQAVKQRDTWSGVPVTGHQEPVTRKVIALKEV